MALLLLLLEDFLPSGGSLNKAMEESCVQVGQLGTRVCVTGAAWCILALYREQNLPDCALLWDGEQNVAID